MTTTVTVKTHDWPVAVTANSNHQHSSPECTSWAHSNTTTFQAAHTEQTYTVTDTQSISVSELAKDATGLDAPRFTPAPA